MLASNPVAPTAAPRKMRDGFIDALRAIALIRVMVWHALGNSELSWVITTMPVMFFVAGSLLYSSLDRAPLKVVMQRRLRRLLVPFWFFGATVLSVCALVDLRSTDESTSFGLGQLWAWIFPLVNPTASEWEAGWASSPLWYLRAYLWILLLSPVLRWAWHRFGFGSLAGGVAIMAAAHALALSSNAGSGSLIWIVGDIGIYGFFVLLGFAHRTGRLDALSRRDLVEWLGVGLCATLVAWQLWPSADGVVNHSYPTLLAYGSAWICLALLARPWLSHALQVPVLGVVLYWMTRRAMSIYLWHSPAIVGSYWLLQRADLAPSAAPVLTITVVLVIIASTLTGWIEDVAAGRGPELLPLPSGVRLGRTSEGTTPAHTTRRRTLAAGVAIGAAASLVAASLIVEPDAFATASAQRTIAVTDEAAAPGLALPPAPSGRPDPRGAATSATGNSDSSSVTNSSLGLPPAPSGRPDPRAAAKVDTPAETTSATAASSPTMAADSIDTILAQWRAAHDVDGVQVGVSMGADDISIQSGADVFGGELQLGQGIPVTSITKTMTAAIVLQLVDEGKLSLDAPLPPLAVAGGAVAEQPITIRQLLNHSAGVVPYQGAQGYDPAASLTPAQAVQLSLSSPLEWTPGAAPGYSNSGFLALGLLIEQTTGQTFETELTQRILQPFGLTETYLDTDPRRGWVGDSAGGVVSTVADLSTWGKVLYRDQAVLSSAMTAEMIRVDAALTSGLGAFPVCPCADLADGSLSYASIGHNGGSVTMQYAPQQDVLIVATFTESFWTDELTQQHVYELLSQIRSAVVG